MHQILKRYLAFFFRRSVAWVGRLVTRPKGVDPFSGQLCANKVKCIAHMILCVAVWTICLYLPYALYIASFTHVAGDEPSFVADSVYCAIVFGSQLSLFIIASIFAGKIGLRYKDNEYAAYCFERFNCNLVLTKKGGYVDTRGWSTPEQLVRLCGPRRGPPGAPPSTPVANSADNFGEQKQIKRSATASDPPTIPLAISIPPPPIQPEKTPAFPPVNAMASVGRYCACVCVCLCVYVVGWVAGGGSGDYMRTYWFGHWSRTLTYLLQFCELPF